MFDLIKYFIIALFGYFLPKTGLTLTILITAFWICSFYLYREHQHKFTKNSLMYIEESSIATTTFSVIFTIMSFGIPYHAGLIDGNFDHTVVTQWMMAIAIVLLGIEYTIKPK